MHKKQFVNSLFEENSTFSTVRQAEMVASLLDTVSTDIYSESQRFVFELIQNADDAATDSNNIVNFDFLSNFLIVSHNGKPFDEKDILSLTGAGASTKQGDPTKTGYKGIGFKSVFGKSERVTIFSAGYQFRFDKNHHETKLPWQIIPIWTDIADLNTEIQNNLSLNIFAVSTVIEIGKSDDLLDELLELLNNGQILLFLRKVSKIIVSKNGDIVLTIEKRAINQDISFDEIILYKNNQELSSWITKTFEQIPIPIETRDALEQDDKTPEKLKKILSTEISFAAKIEEGKIIPLKNEESLIFTYLPTKVTEFGFPFLINGSFLTNAAREGLHEDRIWNQWLFKLAAETIIDWLEILANSKYKFHILKMLTQSFDSSNALKRVFNSSFEIKAKEKAFIPSKSLTLKKTTEIIVDKTGLSDLSFIPTNVLINFINQKENSTFTIDSFVNKSLQRVDKLQLLGVKFFQLENLELFFLSSIFIKNHFPPQNYALIEYFYHKSLNDDDKEWIEKLKDIPFIYSKDNELKSPKAICFPSISFQTEFGDEVKVIHEEVYKKIEVNSKIKNWLEQLGVKEPSDTAYLENEIIGNIENCITIDNYLRITRYLFNHHKKSSFTEAHYKELQNLKLYTTTHEFISANQCFLSDLYEPVMKLETVNYVCKFVSRNYKGTADLISEWKTFFLRLGVVENVSLNEIRMSTSNAKQRYSYFLPFFQNNSTHRYDTNSGDVWYNNITNYSFTIYSLIEFSTEYEFSKLFWEKVLKTIFLRNRQDRGTASWQNKYELDENLFDWCIENAAIFPSTQKKCLKANELFINDKDIMDIAGSFLNVFDYQEPLSANWRKKIPFIEKLELEDYLIILEKIVEQTREEEILRKYNIKKIELIYNKIASLLPNFSEDRKQLIINWSKDNKLLSTNGRFEPANELKWVKIEGFMPSSETLKIIQFPEKIDVEQDVFEELISLFQVQIIDKFIPEFENTRIDVELKHKLQIILPYFIAILDRKKYIDYEQEFERVFSIISQSVFLNVSQIKLFFTYQSETIEGASPKVFKDLNKLYFTSKWKSPVIMFNLVPELTCLLDVKGLNDELRVLLQLEEPEIEDWLIEIGYDVLAIKTRKEYLKSKQEIQIDSWQTAINECLEEEILIIKDDEAEPYYIEEQEAEHRLENIKSFVPTTSPNEFTFENISVTNRTFTNIPPICKTNYSEIQNQEVRENVGHWCEEFVYEFLIKKTLFHEINWVNKDGESGLPYDFVFNQNGIKKFIDVKGTPSSHKDILYLSLNEWVFMFEKAENYSIYRVYNAGMESAKIEIIDNPSDSIKKGTILPNPIILQI